MGFEILIVYRQISVNVEVNKTGEKATGGVKKEIVSLNVFQIYFFWYISPRFFVKGNIKENDKKALEFVLYYSNWDIFFLTLEFSLIFLEIN